MVEINERTLDGLVDELEGTYVFRCAQPVSVDIVDGHIDVGFMPPSTGWVDYSRHVVPLDHKSFFTSFAKLGAHGGPSDLRIRNWVSKFGLPVWGQPNATSLATAEFKQEAGFAHDLLHIYLAVRNRDAAAIRIKVKDPKTRFDELFEKRFAHNKRRWGLGEIRTAPQEHNEAMVLIAAQCALGDLTTDLISTVRPRVGIQRGWFLGSSWQCFDLPSALYLQFYLLATGHKPLRYCEFCGQPFEVTRQDKTVCSPSCRSGLSYQRRKTRLSTDAS